MHKSQAIVLSVAFGCLAFSSAAMIQTPPDSSSSPQRSTPQRPMNSNNADAAKAVLKSLEGSWTISMRMPSDASANAPSAADRMMTGTSSRAWILGDSVLQEEVEIKGGADQGRDANRPRNSGGGPNAQQDPRDQMSDGFEGLGLFSIDGETNGISHVWADSNSDGMIFCRGTYDRSTKTITFASHEGSLSHDGDRSGHAYGDDNRSTNSNDRRDSKDSTGHAPTGNPSTSNDPPSARGGNAPPSGTKDMQRDDNRRAGRDGSGQPLVTLRIINENEHVVTMTQPGSNGQAKTYEITYRRAGGGNAVNNPGSVR